ncbi:MAG: hypothetical protein MOB07_21145, partial [Acidobacteria bacterium]|nr:hypothetical protein [Acidobacteriota bacterium]
DSLSPSLRCLCVLCASAVKTNCYPAYETCLFLPFLLFFALFASSSSLGDFPDAMLSSGRIVQKNFRPEYFSRIETYAKKNLAPHSLFIRRNDSIHPSPRRIGAR